MVLTAAAEIKGKQPAGLRPVEPSRDLRAVADLIARGFDRELDERGRAALRELRWMARLAPVVWWWTQADPAFAESLNGFVWEVPKAGGGREIVGNVSLNRAPGGRDRWIIANVVVEEAWRGRGIGRELTEAAMIEARALGARSVVLQVFQDNGPALHLYTDLGFEEAAAEASFRLEGAVEAMMPQAPGYEIRPWRPADGEASYELAYRTIPAIQQWLRPVKRDDYGPSGVVRFLQQVGDLMKGHRTYRLTAWQANRMAALLTVTLALRDGHHRLALLVDPEHRGELEAGLIGRAMFMLGAAPPVPVQATVDGADVAAVEVLRSYGFEEDRTLLTMRKDYR